MIVLLEEGPEGPKENYHERLAKSSSRKVGVQVSCGYCVSTDGFDEASIRKYIEEQEAHEKEEDQGKRLFD